MAAETPTEKLNREAREKREAQLQIIENEKKDFSYDKLEVYTQGFFKKELIQVMHRTVAKNTTPAELAYFLTVAQQSGLNPINKEIWCYKDSQGNLLVFAGRDGFLKKNKENIAFRGMKSSEVCEFDEFEIDMIAGTVIHKITNNRGKPVGAYCIVYIEGMKDTIVYLDFDEFNLGQAKWKTAPKMMIKKCAQSHALKEAAGMTGIIPEEAFAVQDGRLVQKTVEKVAPPDSDEKAEERLLEMIGKAASKEELEPLFEHCDTIELKEAYDTKFATLNS